MKTPLPASNPTLAAEPSGGARLLARALVRQARPAAMGVACGLGWTATKLATPVLVRRGIDLGIGGRDMHQLVLAMASVAGLGLLTAGIAGLRRYYALSVASRVEADLRAQLFTHLIRLDLGFHARWPAGQLVSRCASDLQQIQQPFASIPLTASNVAMFLGAGVLLLSIDAPLACAALLPTLFVFFVSRQFVLELGPRAGVLQDAIGRLAGVLQEAIAGIRAIKGLGLEPIERQRVRDETEITYAASLRMNETRARFLPLIDFLPALGLVGVLWLGGHRVAQGQLTVGQLVQFNYYVLMLVGPLRVGGMTIAQLQRAAVSAGLIQSLLALAPRIGEKPDAVDLPGPGTPQRGEVRFESVEFAHGDGPPVLRDLSLHLLAGETVALVGATGSGKSSLAALIGRFHDVQGGRVTIDGVDVRDTRLAALRGDVGMVFEDAFLFSGSIRDNIAFAAPRASDHDIEAAARAAGAHDFIVALEGGYGAPVGERGQSLSGGQRQRVALARALLGDPRVLVLDAATSAVDAAKEAEIRAQLADVARRRTTLVIAHKPATLQLADRVLLLHQGRIAAQGTHAELFAHDATYREVLAAANAQGTESGETPPDVAPAVAVAA